MSKKKTKKLAKVDESADQMVWVREPDPRIKEVFEENLAGQHLTFADLERAKNPSGGMTVFDLGGDMIAEIEGVPIHTHIARGWWASTNPTGEPPACASSDGITGTGARGEHGTGARKCVGCPLNEFGSGPAKAPGEPARGKACKERRLMYVLRPGALLPIVVSVPPSSLAAAKRYLVTLASRGLAYYEVATRIALKEARSKGGQEYAAFVFELIAELTGDELTQARERHESFVGLFTGPTADDLAAND